MTELFLKIVNMSITASILVLLVLVLRLVLKKAPKWVNVLLWGLVAVRLVCPFGIESPFSLMPKTDWIVQKSSLTEEDLIYGSTVPDNIPVDAYIDSSLGKDITITYFPTSTPEIEIHKSVSIPFILSCIWLAGIAGMLIYMLISYICVYRRIRSAEKFRDNVYTSESVASPFVFGLIRPRIYLPENMDAVSMSYVIAHEEAHLRRFDHLWKPLGFLLLAVHWFNPLIWLGYILLCRDIEMACDERVVRGMNDEERVDYSEALLECSVSRKMITACPLAFGEVGAKQRIKSVLHYKKPAFWVIMIAVIACITAAVCFLTNPQQTFTIDSMSEVRADGSVVPDETAQILVSLINNSRKSAFPVGADNPNDLSIAVQIDCSDGSMYILHYQYYSGFSFNPAHPGEDDYRSILTYFTPDGKGEKAWQLEHDFDAQFKKWYDEVKPIPDMSEESTEDQLNGAVLTLTDVLTLSAKGHDLTWSDFAGYSHTDIGSGLYIWLLPIDETFSVKVGGVSPRMEPMYVYLCAKTGEEEERIDIRDGGVEEFIRSMEETYNSQLKHPEPVNAYANDIMTAAANAMFNAVWASDIYELEKITTGTAGLTEEILLYRLEYWVTPHINGWDGTDSSQAVFEEVYFAMFHDWSTEEETWARLGTITSDEIEILYSDDGMLAKYGNMYTAAACEMRISYED